MAEEQGNSPDTQTIDAHSEVPHMEAALETDDFAAMFEESLANFKEGEVVRGKIVAVQQDHVLVDIGYKSEGVVPKGEFYNLDELTPGDEYDFFIEEPEDEEGMPILSKIKADKIKNWAKIQDVYEQDGVIQGRIVRRVKGGLKVDIGIDAFMPASQLTWRPTSDLEKFIGEKMDVKIIKLTKRRRNVVVSRRKLLEEQRAGEKEKLLSTIQVGQVIGGEVKNITDFGAFVDVGGIDGLLHVTDMSWGRVKHPSQVVSVGDKIEVMVLNFDPQSERISLGLKQKSENPWKTAEERYPVGAVVRGKVVSMTDYGAFVQLEDGIEGMVHVSEMSWTRRVRHPNEILNIDDVVDVMVLSVDPESEKIALGLKQTQPNPWRLIETKYPVGSAVKGIVRNLADYGAFVEIEEGIDALLHVSDVSWTKKVADPSEVLEKGQEIEVKILSIDPENEKISVGLKQMEDDPWEKVISAHPIGSHVEVEIAKLVSFGAFGILEHGVEGLIHVSELADERIQKPEQVLSVGDKVTAKVISIDKEERKIGLSIKEYERDLERGTESDYVAGEEGARPAASGSSGSVTSAGTSLADQLMKRPSEEAGAEAAPVAAPEAEAEPEAEAAVEAESPEESESEKAVEADAAEESGEASSGDDVVASESAAEEAEEAKE